MNSPDLTVLFNVMLHGFAGKSSGIINNYNWFQNLSHKNAPQTAETIIVKALDNTLAKLGNHPWDMPRSIVSDVPETDKRQIVYKHDMIGKVHETPFSSRSTYAQCVEMGPSGPVRIETMFPLGESGNITKDSDGKPDFDENFFSLTKLFDSFTHRPFPLFK